MIQARAARVPSSVCAFQDHQLGYIPEMKPPESHTARYDKLLTCIIESNAPLMHVYARDGNQPGMQVNE